MGLLVVNIVLLVATAVAEGLTLLLVNMVTAENRRHHLRDVVTDVTMMRKMDLDEPSSLSPVEGVGLVSWIDTAGHDLLGLPTTSWLLCLMVVMDALIPDRIQGTKGIMGVAVEAAPLRALSLQAIMEALLVPLLSFCRREGVVGTIRQSTTPGELIRRMSSAVSATLRSTTLDMEVLKSCASLLQTSLCLGPLVMNGILADCSRRIMAGPHREDTTMLKNPIIRSLTKFLLHVRRVHPVAPHLHLSVVLAPAEQHQFKGPHPVPP